MPRKWSKETHAKHAATVARKKAEREAAQHGIPTPSDSKPKRKLSKVSPDTIKLALLFEALIDAAIVRRITSAFNG
jgi:hypothetical protein